MLEISNTLIYGIIAVIILMILALIVVLIVLIVKNNGENKHVTSTYLPIPQNVPIQKANNLSGIQVNDLSNQPLKMDGDEPPTVNFNFPQNNIEWLRLIDERNPIRTFECRIEQSVTVGRNAGNSIVISDDITVSGTHCCFKFYNGNLVLEDMGSFNGTYLNGQKIMEAVVVEKGAKIQIGASVYILALNQQ